MSPRRRFHIALGVADVALSVEDYSRRLGHSPDVVVPGEYALWRTDIINLSIRRAPEGPGTLRHLGWEDESATIFSENTDINGIVWEVFSAAQQLREIHNSWPSAETSLKVE